MYKTLIRLILTYGCEVWSIKVSDCKALLIFERRIYGPVIEEDGAYRVRCNHEFKQLIGHQNIVGFVKAQKIKCLGHIIRMKDNCTIKKVFMLRESGTRARGRPKSRQLDMVEADLRIICITNYKQKALNRNVRG